MKNVSFHAFHYVNTPITLICHTHNSSLIPITVKGLFFMFNKAVRLTVFAGAARFSISSWVTQTLPEGQGGGPAGEQWGPRQGSSGKEERQQNCKLPVPWQWDHAPASTTCTGERQHCWSAHSFLFLLLKKIKQKEGCCEAPVEQIYNDAPMIINQEKGHTKICISKVGS